LTARLVRYHLITSGTAAASTTALNELQFVLTLPTQIGFAPKSSAPCSQDFGAIE